VSHIHSIPVSVAQSYASAGTQAQQSLKYSSLDLTEAQRTKLRALFRSVKQNTASKAEVQKQLSAILTPAQQQTVSNYIQVGGGNAGQRDHGDVEATSQPSQTVNAPAQAAFTALPQAPTPNAVISIQNQAAAAQSVLIQNLQQQVLATNGATAFA